MIERSVIVVRPRGSASCLRARLTVGEQHGITLDWRAVLSDIGEHLTSIDWRVPSGLTEFARREQDGVLTRIWIAADVAGLHPLWAWAATSSAMHAHRRVHGRLIEVEVAPH